MCINTKASLNQYSSAFQYGMDVLSVGSPQQNASIQVYIYILAWFKTYEFIYGASPAAGCAARAHEHLTRARARCASNDRRAREVRKQGQDANKLSARANKLSKSGFGELICNLALLAHLARARLSLLARLARAPVCACALRARMC